MGIVRNQSKMIYVLVVVVVIVIVLERVTLQHYLLNIYDGEDEFAVSFSTNDGWTVTRSENTLSM